MTIWQFNFIFYSFKFNGSHFEWPTHRGCRSRKPISRFIFLEPRPLCPGPDEWVTSAFPGQGEAALPTVRASVLSPLPPPSCGPQHPYLACLPLLKHSTCAPRSGPEFSVHVGVLPPRPYTHVSFPSDLCWSVTFSVRSSLTIFNIISLPTAFFPISSLYRTSSDTLIGLHI